MTTNENNEIIAGFIGVKAENGWYDGYELHKAGLPFKYGAMGNGTRELSFHKSWDWLMPVVEKIETLEFINRQGRYNITSACFDENYTAILLEAGVNVSQAEGETKLQSVYNVVVKFIKWYNTRHSDEG